MHLSAVSFRVLLLLRTLQKSHWEFSSRSLPQDYSITSAVVSFIQLSMEISDNITSPEGGEYSHHSSRKMLSDFILYIGGLGSPFTNALFLVSIGLRYFPRYLF